MALLAHALASVLELKSYGGFAGSTQDGNFEDALNRATAWLESEDNRQFVTRGDITEYHSLWDGRCELRLSQFPTIAIASIHESSSAPPVYDATTLLTAGTDYQVDKELGCVRRIRSGSLSSWISGYRAIKAIHSYGFRKLDATPPAALPVPDDLKLLCLFVATTIFKESDRARWGVSSVTDAMGSVTRYLGYLPPDMKERLGSYRRRARHRTWEAA